jgi:hypothetical protein
MDYGLLSVNAGIIGAIFVFFAIAAMTTNFSIFNHNSADCSYGLSAMESQIAVTVSVGILLVPFALSSILVLLRQNGANIVTGMGFGLLLIAAMIILTSLSCRIPLNFFVFVMLIPAVATVSIMAFLFAIKKIQFSAKGSIQFAESANDRSLSA